MRNPSANFGEVSKIVAATWDSLDPDNKAAYKKRTELAKKEYLRALASYRANLVSKVKGSLWEGIKNMNSSLKSLYFWPVFHRFLGFKEYYFFTDVYGPEADMSAKISSCRTFVSYCNYYEQKCAVS